MTGWVVVVAGSSRARLVAPARDSLRPFTPMTTRTLLPFLLLALLSPSRGQDAPPPADPRPLVTKAVAAVGGEDKLLKLFRMKERFHFGAEPTPPAGKQPSTRESVLEAPAYWWLNKKDRTDEPAKFDVWGWTLGAITDAKSKIEVVPDVVDEGKPAFGLRVSETVKPPMELYFDKKDHLLVRLDWRSDIYRFSDWKEHDGVKYPSKCIILKKSTGKPWFFHEITELERLKELPAGIERTPLTPP